MDDNNIRLDDMDITAVRDLYNNMFIKLIDKKKLDEIYNVYLEKYNEMKDAEKEGYQAPTAMGRRYNYLKNILYGWYIEDLFYELIIKNPSVRLVERTGKDSEHLFIYNKKTKKISVSGVKSSVPDFLITMHDGKKIYMELKTAAKEIFTVKMSNVKQLNKMMGSTGIYSVILMIDLVNKFYEIKDLKYFSDITPFANPRMEGQICYDFPNPTKEFSNIKKEDFSKYIDNDMFLANDVLKYKCLSLAKMKNDKNLIKYINNKIKLDDICSEFKYQKEEYEKNIKLIKEEMKKLGFDDIKWNDILKELEEK